VVVDLYTYIYINIYAHEPEKNEKESGDSIYMKIRTMCGEQAFS
jgi:hypothetical protein